MVIPRRFFHKRVPPGVWTGAIWCIAALQPIIWPPSADAGREGPAPNALDNLWGGLFLSLSALLVLSACVLLARRPWAALTALLIATASFAVAWRQQELSPLQFLAVDVAVGYLAATRPPVPRFRSRAPPSAH
ncbi:hypothetical protein [Streptomyces sp. SPB074]|uniref:hypothetical protein n=1 Tax=Streptomyces sp. (strain SPB074) TaxID=465543 RepID=UPI00017F21C1|nr:hypothetical protein [Streptomyces sp. SPB074]